MEDKCQSSSSVAVLQRDVEELKVNVKDIDKRITNVEIEAVKREEKIAAMGNLLLEIKGDIKDIKGNRQKFISGIISGVTIAIVAAIILQALKIFHW